MNIFALLLVLLLHTLTNVYLKLFNFLRYIHGLIVF